MLSLALPGYATAAASERLERAQEQLQTLGYEPGTADGLMGPKTRQALRDFQRDQELPVTGKLDAATSTALTEQSSHQEVSASAQTGRKRSSWIRQDAPLVSNSDRVPARSRATARAERREQRRLRKEKRPWRIAVAVGFATDFEDGGSNASFTDSTIGDGITAEAGFVWFFNKSFSMRATLGGMSSQIYDSSNGTSRFTSQLLARWHPQRWLALGLGPAYHFDIEKENNFFNAQREYDNALGLAAHIQFVGVGLSYTKMDYDSNLGSEDASFFNLYWNGEF